MRFKLIKMFVIQYIKGLHNAHNVLVRLAVAGLGEEKCLQRPELKHLVQGKIKNEVRPRVSGIKMFAETRGSVLRPKKNEKIGQAAGLRERNRLPDPHCMVTQICKIGKNSKYSKQANRLTQQKRIAQVCMNCQIIRGIQI